MARPIWFLFAWVGILAVALVACDGGGEVPVDSQPRHFNAPG